MKLLTDNGITRKIIIALVIVILLNFLIPNLSFAGDTVAKVGGVLFEPIKDLLLVIADGIISITQGMLFKMDSSFLSMEHNNSNISTIVGWVVRNRCSCWCCGRNCISSNNRRS